MAQNKAKLFELSKRSREFENTRYSSKTLKELEEFIDKTIKKYEQIETELQSTTEVKGLKKYTEITIKNNKLQIMKKLYKEWNSRLNTQKKCEFECCGSTKRIKKFCYKSKVPRYACMEHIFKNKGRKCEMIGCDVYETNIGFGLYHEEIVNCCNICATKYGDDFELKSF